MNFLEKIDNQIAQKIFVFMDVYSKKFNILRFLEVLFYTFLLTWIIQCGIDLYNKEYVSLIIGLGFLWMMWDNLHDEIDCYRDAYINNTPYNPIEKGNFAPVTTRRWLLIFSPFLIFINLHKDIGSIFIIFSILEMIFYFYAVTYPLKRREIKKHLTIVQN